MSLLLPRTAARAPAARIARGIESFVALRRDLHRHPELAFQEHRTAAEIASLLAQWGYHVEAGIAGTGVVGTLQRGDGHRGLGLRADMDALPITERSGAAHASRRAGIMHACGHDGHTAILLAAAQDLALHGRFDGRLHVIFQPAEEVGAGARRMIGEGLFQRYPCDAVFALHNWPGVPEGRFGFVEGPAMAAIDQALIQIHGRGGHGAAPHETVDPVVVAAHAITALQTIVSRNVDPLDMAVVTVGAIQGGEASNVIPDSVALKLTARSYRPEARALLQRRIPALVQAQAESFGAVAEVEYRLGFPSVVNHVAETAFARGVAAEALGAAAVLAEFRPRTASEDFAFMLEACPGSYLFLGAGEGPPLHSPSYDFNDALILPGAIFWSALAQAFLSPS
ncbi:M20 family metallopeptidase [Roseomonas sp. GC11]|uniref:M20 aminoacylase family protein n=1 Tax=Roseomonas sp. GC11 TaxID=2950546 RepID=UPI00210B63B9|nr:M20 aminoacylase family protein [Roseomonas sp. GC11]MCQ4159073.1 M20 family metallopeptidase [Roseomonas sp. GC11]